MIEKLMVLWTEDVRLAIAVVFVCCVFAVIACIFDMWTAVDAVRATGGRLSSHPMRRTGVKIVDYLRMILYVMMIDLMGCVTLGFYRMPWCAVVVTVGILVREGLSMRENYKLKKSNAGEAIDIAQKIVECLTKEEAERIIRKVGENVLLGKKK